MEVKYQTLDNCNAFSPLVVAWDPKADFVQVFINLEPWGGHDKHRRGRRIAYYTYVRQFLVGHCPFTRDSSALGNTVLFCLGNSDDDGGDLTQATFRYVWVGPCVYEFDLPERVLYYVSPLNRDGSPEPYAVTKSRTYMLGNGSVDVIENAKLAFTPPTYAEYAKLCRRGYVRDIDEAFGDYEIQAVVPTFWLREQPNKADLVQTIPVTITFERGADRAESYAYGRILASLDKQHKR